VSVERGTEPVTGTPFASIATLKARDLAIPRDASGRTSLARRRSVRPGGTEVSADGAACWSSSEAKETLEARGAALLPTNATALVADAGARDGDFQLTIDASAFMG